MGQLAACYGRLSVAEPRTAAGAQDIPLLCISLVVSAICCILGFVASRVILSRYVPLPSPRRLAAVRTQPPAALAEAVQLDSPVAEGAQYTATPSEAAAEGAARANDIAKAAEDEAQQQTDPEPRQQQQLPDGQSVPETPGTPTAQAPFRGAPASEDSTSVASTASIPPAAPLRPPPDPAHREVTHFCPSKPTLHLSHKITACEITILSTAPLRAAAS